MQTPTWQDDIPDPEVQAQLAALYAADIRDLYTLALRGSVMTIPQSPRGIANLHFLETSSVLKAIPPSQPHL